MTGPSGEERGGLLRRLGRLLRSDGGEAGPGQAVDETRVAVAALLVEAARMDDLVGAEEQAAIARLLAARFDLDAAAVDGLVRQAEDRADQAVELFQFTRRLVPSLDEDRRIELVEMLWEVALADGQLDALEDSLIRRIAGLVHVSDQARGAARQRVLARRRDAG
jgi:uncharacterized tellurite resistance protein B-like protein